MKSFIYNTRFSQFLPIGLLFCTQYSLLKISMNVPPKWKQQEVSKNLTIIPTFNIADGYDFVAYWMSISDCAMRSFGALYSLTLKHSRSFRSYYQFIDKHLALYKKHHIRILAKSWKVGKVFKEIINCSIFIARKR